MKKACVLLLSLLLILCFSMTSFADVSEKNSVSGEEQSVFEKGSVTESVKDNLDKKQVAEFFEGNDYCIDFSHLMAVYMPLDTSKKTTLKDALLFDCSYVVPVQDNTGKTVGMAKLLKYNEKWVVGVFFEGYDLINKVKSAGGDKLKEAVFIENPYTNEFAILTGTSGEEVYVSLDSDKFEKISGKDVLNNIGKKEQSSVNGVNEGTGSIQKFSQAIYILIVACGMLFALVVGRTVYKKRSEKR